MMTIKHGIQISGHMDSSKKYLQTIINYMLPLSDGEKKRITK